MSITCHISTVFECNPDLDHGQCQLDLATTIGINHINPKLWLGDTCIGEFNLAKAWN
jgi:hypothetical protein